VRPFWSVAAFAVPLAALWLLAGPELGEELSALPAWAVAGAIGAHVATLACRAEAWRLAVNSIAGGGVPRPLMHGACAVGFAAGSVQAASAAPVRAFALRRREQLRVARSRAAAIAVRRPPERRGRALRALPRRGAASLAKR
jgi:hypothetical protein